ncbi:hypothetical protein D8Y22_12830 [Salinadaptatus halalkaliphilus]|uniref:Uncharacterized protein n=1 Tax=Salinadaptatus halalkaliphilus TaxID=2419781 RepID=A0A4S3TK84_9EURY|nr:hypothetical protein [Salinadaptatus halalkaliphilus]THE64522.1 hypothetical protein D8Y22_12830 [Salinadaptatus halalkaliphilus]
MPTDEQYLEDLREFAAELGKTPTRPEMNEDGPHSSTPYYNRWDSWNGALEAAGLEPNHEYVSEDDLLADLRRIADEHGHPVRIEDVEEHGNYDPSTYYGRFDSWFDARDQAGLEADDVRPGRRVDADALIDAVQELALELGRPPSKAEMNDRGEYSASPYLTRWGTWEEALEVAGVATDS